MKSNKRRNVDYTRFFKPCLIVIFALILISAVVVGLFGFNLGLDFTGGTQLVVEFTNTSIEAENDEDLANARDEVVKILGEHNVDINSFQVQGAYNSRSFVITFANVSDDVLNSIRLDINRVLNEDDSITSSILNTSTDLTRNTSEIDSFVLSSEFLTIVSTLIFAVTLICIYACFRFKVAGGLTILFGAVVDILLLLSFIILARIEINRYIFTVLALIMALSIYASVSMLIDIKDKARDPNLSTKSNADIVNLSVEESWKKSLFVYLTAFVLLIIWGILSTTNVLYVLIAIIAGIAVVFGTHIFVAPAFWSAIQKTKETFTKRGIIRTENTGKTAVKPVVTTENNKDDSAEVIEVKD